MSEQEERWQVVRNARSHHIERDGEERVYYIADVGDFDALCKRLNALEAQVDSLQQQVRDAETVISAVGPCTPYRWIGTEHCQHGYERGHCPIMAYRNRALSSPDTGSEEGNDD